jgi:hypothetical protein
LRLHDKRGKKKFKAAVAKCLDREILTTERVRKFLWRVCQYICAYYKIAKEREGQQIATEATTHLDASPIQVEKMVKLFKTHCCAMGFDTHFCKAVFIKQEHQEVSAPYYYYYY